MGLTMKNKRVLKMMESKGMTGASLDVFQRRIGMTCLHLKKEGMYNAHDDLINVIKEIHNKHYKGAFSIGGFGDVSEPFDGVFSVPFNVHSIK